MADIKINLLVTSNGSTEQETKHAKELANQLERAKRAAELLQRSNPPSGGGPTPPPGGSGPGPRPGESPADAARRIYNERLGSRGQGSAASDFARQASGLGGLVHVYATFAANIFAVGAAFRALSKAADTSNMVKGLDQLGAASGRNLSGLAKQLVEVSDGAISLKDSLTATAQASAGGLSASQLLRLTAVAKNASQALGRDMPDALSRLTRGIVKIEPELLDELGIMVKVTKANADYARELGKTSAALTDIEKRQAFANATITQGEKKFKDIQMNANPYTKIQASVSNLLHSGLELVNKVIGPVINLLSSSPTALTAAIAALTALLLKQAIPALGQWRANLAATATASREASIKINNDFKQFQQDLLRRNQPWLTQALDQQKAFIEASKNALNSAAVASGRKLTAGMREAMATPIANITQAQVDRLMREEQALRNRVATLTAQSAQMATPQAAASKLAQAEERRQQAENTKRYITGLEGGRAAVNALSADERRAHEQAMKNASALGEAKQRQRLADRAERQATQSQILSNVGQNTQIMGMAGAFSKLREETRAARMEAQAAGKSWTGLASASTMVKGSFGIATSAISGFMSAFSPWLMAITIGIMLGGLLVKALKSNGKELEAFGRAATAAEGAASTLNNTLELISKKEPMERLSIDSILARANAFGELVQSLDKLVDTFEKAEAAASGFDRFIDQTQKLWGGDIRTKMTKTISTGIVDSVKGTSGKVKDELETSLAAILNSADLTASGVTKALDSIDVTNEEEAKNFIALQYKISEAITQANKATKSQSNIFAELKNTLDNVGKSASNLVVSMTAQDTFTAFATSVVSAAAAMAMAFERPEDALLTLMSVIKDVGSLSTVSEPMAKKLIGELPLLQKQVEELENAKQAVKLYADAIGAANKTIEESTANSFYDVEVLERAKKDLSGSKQGKKVAEKLLIEVEGKIQKSSVDLLKVAVEDAFKNGASLLALAMKNANEAAAITIAKASAAGLTGPGTADVTYNLKLRELALQEAQITAEMGLLTSQMENKSALERLSNVITLDTQTRIKQSAEIQLKGADVKETARLTKVIDTADKSIASTEKAIAMGDKLASNLLALKGLTPRQANTKLTGMISEASDRQDLGAMTSLQATQGQIMGGLQKQIALEAEKEAAAITRKLEVLKEQKAVMEKLKSDQIESLDLNMKSLEAAESASTVFSEELQAAKLANIEKRQSVQLSKEKAVYENMLADLQSRPGIDTGPQQAQLNKDRSVEITASAKKNTQELAAFQADLANKRYTEQLRLQGIETTRFNMQQELSKAQLEYSEQLISSKQALNEIDEIQFIREESAIARNRQALDFEAQQREQRLAYENKIAESKIKSNDQIKNASIAGTDVEPLKAKQLMTESQITAEYEAQQTLLTTVNGLKLQGIALTEQTNTKLAKQAQLTKTMESIAFSMTKAFGKVGSAISDIARSFQSNAEAQTKIQKRKNNELEEMEKKGLKGTKEYNKVKMKYNSESTAAEMDSYAQMSGAAASMFDEKSSAAKTLHAMEVGFHIAKMAMEVKAMLMDQTSTAASMVNSALRAGKSVVAGVAKAFEQMGVYGFIGAAAIIAFMASFGVGGGGGGGGGGFNPSAEQLRDTQGTGQRYDDKGKLVDTGYGALGDSSKKSESITKSLELMAEYAFEELEYSNKMLMALQNIEASLTGVSKSLVLTTGLTGGTAFGTIEEKIAGTFLNNPFDKLSQKITNSIFGGDKERTITGSGINIAGSLSELAAGRGKAEQYETGEVKTSGGLFRSDKTEVFRNAQDLSDSFRSAMGLAFANVSAGLVQVGTTLGLNADELAAKINSIPINMAIETRGLKGKELQDAVTAVMSATMDMITEKALEVVKPYQQIGEGLAETAFRVANTSRVIDLQLKAIGKSFSAVGLSSLQARMDLIELVGGLEEFTSSAEFFRTTFLSEAEQLIPVQKAVTDELARLNLSSIDTKEEFKNLVLSLDLVKQEDRQLYASLMALQKGFAKVYEEVEDLSLTLEELADAKLDQTVKILTLLNDKAGVNNILRAKELKDMDARLKPMQMWIYALEDEATARDELVNAYDRESNARQASIDKLKNSRQTLVSFSDSLKLGGTSPLTPGQKYAQAKSDLAAVTSVLNDAMALPADREKALEKLPSAISNLLDTSKLFNASSLAYQVDYAMSQALLQSNVKTIEDQLTVEEESLAELRSQVQALGVINLSVLSVSDAIKNFQEAVTKTDQAASQAGPDANQLFVDSLYRSTPLLSETDTEGKKFWTDMLNTGKMTQSQVKQDVNQQVLIRSWYQNVLKREPETEGLHYWLNRLRTDGDFMRTKSDFALAASWENKLPPRAIDTFAKGGLMSGMALVGEVGPEIVNFDNPGQVYSNSQSKNIFADYGKEMANAIKSLEDEVKSLKKQMNDNARMQIEANHTSNMLAANQVSTTVKDTASVAIFTNTRNTSNVF